jgi:DNA-binding PadR family transcriptional regulator
VKASAKYAVLGLLLERPSYGYELLGRFRQAFGGAGWTVSPQALYAALDRLERDGLVEPVADARGTTRRQPKRPYLVTAAGAAELRRFLAAPMGADPPRAELLLRLRCGAAEERDALARMLDAHERACREELGRLGDAGAAAGQLVERLAREQRRLGVEARLAWVDYARRQLREAAPADAPPARRERLAVA